jgi:hypothetical protein
MFRSIVKIARIRASTLVANASFLGRRSAPGAYELLPNPSNLRQVDAVKSKWPRRRLLLPTAAFILFLLAVAGVVLAFKTAGLAGKGTLKSVLLTIID